MTHLIVKITNLEIVAPYTLKITFDDGVQRTINFAPVLVGYYLEPLRDIEVFNQAQVDTEVHTIVWQNGADFDPATLYNWDEGDGAELAKRAAHWRHHASTVAN
jgi:hypothetical protein